MKQKKDTGLIKVRISIGAKLITMITIIVLVSLGSITALVSWLVSEDLRLAAEENNFEVNRRSAMEAERTLEKMRSDSLVLVQTVDINSHDKLDFFFEQNPQIAAIIFSDDRSPSLVSRRYFVSHDIDESLAASYRQLNASVMSRAAMGETLLMNAAPHFAAPLLSLFFPWRNGGAAVIFSPDNLNDTFAFGSNNSWLINDSGDILIHADFELVRSGANTAGWNFTRFIRGSSARNMQTLYTGEDGLSYFGAFTKLNIAGCTVITSIEYDKVFEGIAATTRRNIYLTSAILFLSILLIWFFAKSISVPLKVLAAAARNIEEGSFEVDLKPKGRDEVGVLTASFKRMCTALGIFGRFTNRDIAVRAMRGEIKPGGLPKHATVFFSDIRGFTAKSEEFTKAFGEEASNRIVLWLNEYLTQMVDCVERTGGVVDKFIGDAVMAHWGTAYTSGSPQKDAYNCIKAALMMRSAVFEMNKERSDSVPGNPPILIGCGINTGIVTAGQIGSELRMEYTVIGDPVNLASRIESLNKPLGTDILISEDTWRLVKDYFITEEMPSVTVKGKAKPVRIFAVINVSALDKGPKTLADVRKLMGIKNIDVSKIDVNAGEKKYKIGKAD